MLSSDHLWQAYKGTYFRWQSAALKATQFAIITAYNPRSEVLTDARNARRQDLLEQQLITQGLDYAHILAGDRKLEYTEVSLAVDCDLHKAIELASTYSQNAIFYVDEDSLLLVPILLNAKSTERLGSFNCRLVPT